MYIRRRETRQNVPHDGSHAFACIYVPLGSFMKGESGMGHILVVATWMDDGWSIRFWGDVMSMKKRDRDG